MTAHRYASMDSATRRQAARQVREELAASGRSPAATAGTYAQLAADALITHGTADHYWIYCYELCCRLSRARMFARKAGAGR